MNLAQYQAEAQNTKSDKFYGEKISMQSLNAALDGSIHFLGKLDVIKKALFYNKPAEMYAPKNEERSCNFLGNISIDADIAVDLVHGIIGKATEAAELLQALRDCINTGARLDAVNVLEEVGDGFWYDAVIMQALGTNFEYVASINNGKLKTRFPDKFNEANAIKRDLPKERAVLEGRS